MEGMRGDVPVGSSSVVTPFPSPGALVALSEGLGVVSGVKGMGIEKSRARALKSKAFVTGWDELFPLLVDHLGVPGGGGVCEFDRGDHSVCMREKSSLSNGRGVKGCKFGVAISGKERDVINEWPC